MLVFFFFNDTATTEIYTLSLHDALPISFVALRPGAFLDQAKDFAADNVRKNSFMGIGDISATRWSWVYTHDLRSEEHTSELQSRLHLVCRLLLEKKKK